MSDPEIEPLSFFERLSFAFTLFFRVLFDPAFATGVFAWREAGALPPAEAPRRLAAKRPRRPRETEPEPEERERVEKVLVPRAKKAKPRPAPEPAAAPDAAPALQMLALFQREGRLVDFLEQDVTGFSDADVGAAARVVHEGCRKALRAHARVEPIRPEEEGARVTLEDGFDPAEVKLSGNVQGKAPYTGSLLHRGWRARELTLPVAVKGHDPGVLAPAEVEL